MDQDLISINDFAAKYRVSEETVRGWIKRGYVDYEMVGPRKMIRKSQVIKNVEEEEPTIVTQRS